MDVNQCPDLIKMMKKGIIAAFIIFAFLVSIPPGQVAVSATLETEVRVQIVVDPSGLRDESLPLPDFHSTQFRSPDVTDPESSPLRVDGGSVRHLPKLNELIRSSLAIGGSGMVLIASVLYGRKKYMDRLILKKG